MLKQNPKKNNKKIGMYYEQVAKDYLIQKGYRIQCMNYRCKLGEIDIIAKDKEYIVFIEVKYRTTSLYGYPREYVNTIKQRRIINSAKYYLMVHHSYQNASRFDVIDILDQKITHIESAFS